MGHTPVFVPINPASNLKKSPASLTTESGTGEVRAPPLLWHCWKPLLALVSFIIVPREKQRDEVQVPHWD